MARNAPRTQSYTHRYQLLKLYNAGLLNELNEAHAALNAAGMPTHGTGERRYRLAERLCLYMRTKEVASGQP